MSPAASRWTKLQGYSQGTCPSHRSHTLCTNALMGGQRCPGNRVPAVSERMCKGSFAPETAQCARCQQDYYPNDGASIECYPCDQSQTFGYFVVIKFLASQVGKVPVGGWGSRRGGRPRPSGRRPALRRPPAPPHCPSIIPISGIVWAKLVFLPRKV